MSSGNSKKPPGGSKDDKKSPPSKEESPSAKDDGGSASTTSNGGAIGGGGEPSQPGSKPSSAGATAREGAHRLLGLAARGEWAPVDQLLKSLEKTVQSAGEDGFIVPLAGVLDPVSSGGSSSNSILVVFFFSTLLIFHLKFFLV